MSRPARPSDLLAFRIPTEPHLSPDGRLVAFSVQSATGRADEYRRALWIAETDGGNPAAPPTPPARPAPVRQLTIGWKQDHHPRFSPDGRTLAFLSDRRLSVEVPPPSPEDREDGVQVHLLPLDGGEARRLTDLPRGVEAFEWSPDGSRLVVVTTSHGATREEDARVRGKRLHIHPDEPRTSDYRYVDRLEYMLNGVGFTYDRVAHLWLVDATTGEARRLTDGPASDGEPAWSPDGTRIAFVSKRSRDRDLVQESDLYVVDVAGGVVTTVTGGARGLFGVPGWLPDGRTIAALGHRYPANAGSRNDVWLFAADGSDAHATGGRNLSERHDLMPGSMMNSDITPGEAPRLVASPDGAWLTFSAPLDGAYQLWRIATDDGAIERLTDGAHYVSGWDVRWPDGAMEGTLAFVRSTPTELPEVWLARPTAQSPATAPIRTPQMRRLTSLNDEAVADLRLSDAAERWVDVEGSRIQGWYVAPVRDDGAAGPAPVVTEIHGGPHTLYGFAPLWEAQVLAGAGIGVFYSNPRGSEGYGEAFNAANFRDWGDGPMRDVLAGVDALVADGLADPGRLGLTGGSYGGYLTNWIIARDGRFRAAFTARSVSDLQMLMLTGDISGGEFGRLEFGARPWEDPELYRALSPITYATGIRTPLLIQHSERDIRTTIGQAEALFTVLRSLRRPVRLMRVPDETHELTRSGTPFRRVENLVQVRDWFAHFLVAGRRGLPPLPKERGGK